MTSDAALRTKAMECLICGLGEVEAERFISLIVREPFDYTEWRKTALPKVGIRELSRMAMASMKPHSRRRSAVRVSRR